MSNGPSMIGQNSGSRLGGSAPSTSGIDPDPDACPCNPCMCDSPPDTPVFESSGHSERADSKGLSQLSGSGMGTRSNPNILVDSEYKLNEFTRTKQLLLKASTNTGLTLYDHLSEIIRKIMDERAPSNAVDYLEELSMNIKKYRFGLKDDSIKDAFYTPSTILDDSQRIIDNWRQHASLSAKNATIPLEDASKNNFGGFRNLLRFHYYLEQTGTSLPKEEMFRIALAIRELSASRPQIRRIRFWGKIFGTHGNYYIAEAETDKELVEDLWNPSLLPDGMDMPMRRWSPTSSSHVLGSEATFNRAGAVVKDLDSLSIYEETSGNKPSSQGQDSQEPNNEEEAKWEQFIAEVTSGFPIPKYEKPVEIPPEEFGVGTNRRSFFVCNNLNGNWVLLPRITPKQITMSRAIRWQFTGDLNRPLKNSEFPGREANYLRAILARITAGTQVSPNGYFKTKDETPNEVESLSSISKSTMASENESPANDLVYPSRNFVPSSMAALIDPSGKAWVHHASHILQGQGRVTWFEEYDQDEEEEDGTTNSSGKEFNPPLFSPLSDDKSLDGTPPWSFRASSSLFAEFQIAVARSNLWPGAIAICTPKGKVENIYIGDGQKLCVRSWAPFTPGDTQKEYRGIELKEMRDMTPEEEKEYLTRIREGRAEEEGSDTETRSVTGSSYTGTETGTETGTDLSGAEEEEEEEE